MESSRECPGVSRAATQEIAPSGTPDIDIKQPQLLDAVKGQRQAVSLTRALLRNDPAAGRLFGVWEHIHCLPGMVYFD
ncbi:MAG TPA: hypothetical protein VNX46_18375, partial [Candidatus Acidoferrum sp.]|nr:hypothetical protein [Candidatus Acidoferrum sp.]